MFDSIDRATEKALREQVSTANLKTDTQAFADLRRYPGSDDQWEAANYIVDTLADAEGVEAELLTFEAYTSIPENASVTVNTPERRVFDDAITTAFSANTPSVLTARISQCITRRRELGFA